MENKKNVLVEIYGWYGAIGLLAAYALSSFGIVTVSLYKKTYQPGILNIIWAIVGMVALFKISS